MFTGAKTEKYERDKKGKKEEISIKEPVEKKMKAKEQYRGTFFINLSIDPQPLTDFHSGESLSREEENRKLEGLLSFCEKSTISRNFS